MATLAKRCLQATVALLNLGVLAMSIVVIVYASLLLGSTNNVQQVAGLSAALIILSIVMVIASIFGFIVTFACRTKAMSIILMVLAAVLAIGQISIGSYALATGENNDTVFLMSKSIWTSYSETQRIDFGKDNKCCGYFLVIPTSPFTCAKQGLFEADCGPVLESKVQTSLRNSGTVLIIAAVVQLMIGGIELVLFIDNGKRFGHVL
jgi:hypothetical protein